MLVGYTSEEQLDYEERVLMDIINIYYDPEEDTNKVDQCYLEAAKLNIEKGYWTSFLLSSQPVHLTGPAYGPNYHFWIKRLKETFDSNNISNPPGPYDQDVFVEKAEWMHPIKDW